MSDNRSRARDRQESRKRRRREAMVTRVDSPRQIVAPNKRQTPKFQLPRWWRLVSVIISFIIISAVVILGLGFINPLEIDEGSNAIWLDQQWTYTSLDDSELIELGSTLNDNQINLVFAYTSSLLENGAWGGNPDGRNRFSEVQTSLRNFVQRMKQINVDGQVFAWVEIQASTPDGYRLSSSTLHQTVADFSRQLIENFGFDGILLDVKPIFDDNMDVLALMRTVRATIGIETPIAIALSPDLTPTDAGIVISNLIAPDTARTEEYKQRVALQADMVVVTAYNSYLNNPVDYINWVQYQVETFGNAMTNIDTSAELLISIPNYAEIPQAHDPSVESIAGALDGVARGIASLDDERRGVVRGVAIFTDSRLNENDWRIFQEKWLDAP